MERWEREFVETWFTDADRFHTKYSEMTDEKIREKLKKESNPRLREILNNLHMSLWFDSKKKIEEVRPLSPHKLAFVGVVDDHIELHDTKRFNNLKEGLKGINPDEKLKDLAIEHRTI